MIKDVAPLPGYPEQIGLLLAVLQDATQDWRQELFVDDLPPKAITWRVRPGGPSIGSILLHMVDVELYWFEKFALEAEVDKEHWDLLKTFETNVDEDKWPDAYAEPLSWYFALQDRYRERTLETLKCWPAPETFKTRGDGQYSLRWVLGHVIQHESYHGGQIVMVHDQWKKVEEKGEIAGG